jgi:hypothetical protein
MTMATLGQSLRDAVRKLAYGASIEQLKKRGIKQVNVVGIDRIVALVEEAVNRSLRNKLRGLDRSFVADAAKSEFMRMLRDDGRTDPDAELHRMYERAEEEVDDLRDQLGRARKLLDERLGLAAELEAGRYAGENEALAKQIHELFGEFVREGRNDLGRLRDAVLEKFAAVLDQERQAAVAAREAARDREIDVLERRIAKMTQALEENEARLAEVAMMRPGDEGLASIYREVQGLRATARDYERKRALMTEIFRANLALQKGIAG